GTLASIYLRKRGSCLALRHRDVVAADSPGGIHVVAEVVTVHWLPGGALHSGNIVSINPTRRIHIADQHTHRCRNGVAQVAGRGNHVGKGERDITGVGNPGETHRVLIRVRPNAAAAYGTAATARTGATDGDEIIRESKDHRIIAGRATAAAFNATSAG